MWTDEMVDLLKAEHLAGSSATMISRQIAEKFNVSKSRNAVIGKLHRMGLVRSLRDLGHVYPKARRALPLKPVAQGGTGLQARVKMLRALHAKMEAAVNEKPAREGPVGGIELLNLERWHCRWVLNDPRSEEGARFCGAEKVAGYSYCAHHCNRALNGFPEPRTVPTRRAA